MSIPHHTYHRRRGYSRGSPLSLCIGLIVLFFVVIPLGAFDFGPTIFIVVLLIMFFGIIFVSRASDNRYNQRTPLENSTQYGSMNQDNYAHPSSNTTPYGKVQPSNHSEKHNSHPFCSYCGEKVESGISFCSHCGANLEI